MKTSSFFKLLFSFCIYSGIFLGNSVKAEEEFITTIILINGEAELADITKSGEVLKRIIAVPEYFHSRSSHNRLVKRSKEKAEGLSSDLRPDDNIVQSGSLVQAETENKNTQPVVSKSNFRICPSHFLLIQPKNADPHFVSQNDLTKLVYLFSSSEKTFYPSPVFRPNDSPLLLRNPHSKRAAIRRNETFLFLT